jgi:hypothetical protein
MLKDVEAAEDAEAAREAKEAEDQQAQVVPEPSARPMEGVEAAGDAKGAKEAEGQRTQVVPEPSTRPNRGWLRREVREIAKSEGLRLSQRAERKAMAELENVIRRAGDGCRQSIHKSLTNSFVSVACGWFISGGFLDFATIGGQTLLQGTGNHQRDQKRDLPASKRSLTARDPPSLHGTSSIRFRNAIFAN